MPTLFNPANKLSITGDPGPTMGPFRPVIPKPGLQPPGPGFGNILPDETGQRFEPINPFYAFRKTGGSKTGVPGVTQTAGSSGGSSGKSFLDTFGGVMNNINSAFNSAFRGVPNAPGTKLGFLLRRLGKTSDSILTSGRGVTDNAPVRQRKAGGRLRRV